MNFREMEKAKILTALKDGPLNFHELANKSEIAESIIDIYIKSLLAENRIVEDDELYCLPNQKE